MTQTIPDGGLFPTQKDYVGPAGEIRVDASNWDLLLHDGATPGGRRLQNRDNADTRYQRRSSELDGLAGFAPNVRGQITRLAPGNYAVRSLQGTVGQITVSFGDGFGGNPTISLPDVITKSLSFSQQVFFNGTATFAGPVDADAGIEGNLTGNVVGNLTGNTTGLHKGGLDARGAGALQFDNAQIPAAAIAGLVASLADAILPVGSVIMWAGAANAIPVKWRLCDGANGTPNLVGRFIAGAAADGIGQSGGAATHTHTASTAAAGSHNHAVAVEGTALNTTQIPSHRHKNGVTDKSSPSNLFPYGTAGVETPTSDSIDNNPSDGVSQGWTSYEGGSQPHTHNASSTAAGNHTHDMSVQEAPNLPLYYALAFIIKIA